MSLREERGIRGQDVRILYCVQDHVTYPSEPVGSVEEAPRSWEPLPALGIRGQLDGVVDSGGVEIRRGWDPSLRSG